MQGIPHVLVEIIRTSTVSESRVKLTHEQVNTFCKGDQKIAGYVHTLPKVIEQQTQCIVQLEKHIHELERQLG